MFDTPVSKLAPGAPFAISTGRVGQVVEHFKGSSLVRFRGTVAVSFATIDGRTVEFDRPGKPVTISLGTMVEAL